MSILSNQPSVDASMVQQASLTHLFMRKRVLLQTVLGVVALEIALLALRVYVRYSAALRFRAEMGSLGARVILVGYRDIPTGLGRIPILGELLGTRQQVELCLQSPTTVDAVLNAAAVYSDLDRIYIDLAVFDLQEAEAIADRIRLQQPDRDIVYYTPRPALQAALPPSP